MENNQTIPTIKMNDVLEEVIHFVQFTLTKLRATLALLIITTLIALAYYYMQKPTFQASTTFIMEEKSSMGGGLSGLASQFGVDIGGGLSNSNLFAGDNILDIIRSRTIVEKVLLSKVDSSTGTNNNTLADVYINFNQLHKKWSGIASLNNFSFAKILANPVNNRLQDSILFVIYKDVIKKNLTVDRLNKKGSIVVVTTNSGDEVFSKLLTERLVMETMKMYIEIKTSVATRNVARLQQRSDSLMQVLNAKSYKSASLQVLDANIAFKSSAVPVEVSQRDKSVTYALYSEVMKNLEASRMAMASQTPIINILDTAKYPLEKVEKRLIVLLMVGWGFSMVVILAWAFITYASPKNSAN